MAALARKQSRRTAIRKELSLNIAECKGAVADDECLRVTILGLKTNLERTIRQLNEVDEEILNAIDAADIENDMSESRNVLRPTYEIIAGLELKLEKLTLAESATVNSNPSSTSAAMSCKLPKLELPVFKGQAMKWQSFWDQFEVSIHQNESLSEVNKFSYLKRFLSGDALACVSGLMLSSANYKEAVDVLNKRYGNPQVLITANMEALLKLNKVKGKDLHSLRKLYNEVENCLRSLKSLKVETSTYGSLLLPLLREKLPEDFILQIGRRFGSNVWTLDGFMNFFEEELSTAENCFPTTRRSESTNNEFTTSSFYGQVDQHRGFSQKSLCVYCNREGHASSQCRNVTNVRSRKDILRRSARCFVCLEKGHRFVDCSVEYECRICKQRHNVSICEKRFEQRRMNNERHVERGKQTGERFVAKDNGKGESESKEVHANVSMNSSRILLQTATAEISNDRAEHTFSRILFDCGSQRSYVKEELAFRLNLKVIRKEKVVIKTFGRDDEAELRCLNVVALKVRHKSRRGMSRIVEALCVPTLCSPLSMQSLPDSKKFEHLVSLDLADDFDCKGLSVGVDILIGCDYYHSFFTGRVIHRGNECPTASESLLGWVLSGPVKVDGVSNGGSHCLESVALRCDVSEIDDLKDELRRFWELENINESESDVVNSFQRDISFNGDRYVVKLPFKPDHDLIPDNFVVCSKRLKSLKKKLEKTEMIADYEKIFKEYERDKIIEKVPDDEIVKGVGEVHYLPHRPVVKEHRLTTKIRAVFDASCESEDGPSLNNCLYSGPNMLSKIFDVLMRFRFNRVAVLADIKKAFLNVEVADEHRDFLRFLWFNLESEEDDEIVVYRFLRVVFGLTSSPFLLNGTLKNHLEKYRDSDKDLIERLIDDFYVDDLVSGCNSVDAAKRFVVRSSEIMLEAGLELRKWVTNDPDLRKFFLGLHDEGTQTVCNEMNWDGLECY